MNNDTEITLDNRPILRDVFSWFFGIVFLAVGLINTFWGNDTGYGIFIILLSFVFFPPVTAFFKKISGIPIHLVVKVILALFIIWSALGVAELPDKIDLMLKDF